MRPTIASLRTGLLLGGGALVLALVGMLGWAHFRARRELRGLPARLGADIQREANGFTYSQTSGGRVLFTLHARRATQHKTGEAQLDDAGLVLYGDNTGRADRIYGKNFLYDQGAGVVKAVGVVQLDLGAPAPASGAERLRFAGGGALPAGHREAAGAQVVQATTSGLVYTQATGMATTAEEVRFHFRGMEGAAVGATYATRDGTITLEHHVQFAGEEEGRSVRVTASHALLRRGEGQVLLDEADVHVAGAGAAGEQEVRASRLLLRLATEGGVGRVEGTGGVELRSAGDRVRAPEGVLLLRRGSVPERLQLRGGVQFERAGAKADERLAGSAERSDAQFDGAGQMVAERLTGAARVHLTQSDGSREMTGQVVQLKLAEGRELRDVTAEGDAQLRTVDGGAEQGGRTSVLGGDRVAAQFAQGGKQPELQRVEAIGHAELRRTESGLEEHSRAPSIEATFAPAAKGGVALLKVVQDGGVVLDREQRGKAKGEAEHTHAVARTASYDATTGKSVLTGGAELAEADRVVKADRVVVDNETGNAVAEGSVQGTLLAREGADAAARASAATSAQTARQPMHLVGGRALLERAAGVVTIYGAGGREARLWQGAAAVQAPVLLLRQGDGTMEAYGTGSGTALPVEAVLPMSGAGESASATARGATGGVVRVRSGRMHVVNGAKGVAADRRVEFSGGVQMEGADGTVRAREAVATLATARAGQPSGAGLGRLERVVARGDVRVEQPGREATGEELVWTAADGTFLLTGTPSAPPTVTDAVNGRVSGGQIQFRTADKGVVVTGAGPGRTHGRVETETRLRERP